MLLLGLLASLISVTLQKYPCFDQHVDDISTVDSQTLHNISYPSKLVDGVSCAIRVALSDNKTDCSGPLTVIQEGLRASFSDGCLVESPFAITCYCSNYITISCNNLVSLFASTSVRVKEIPCIRRRLFQLFRPNSVDYEALLDKMNKDLDDNVIARAKAVDTSVKYTRLEYLYTDANIAVTLRAQFSSIMVVYFFLYSISVFVAICYFTYILVKKYYPYFRENV